MAGNTKFKSFGGFGFGFGSIHQRVFNRLRPQVKGEIEGFGTK